MRTLCFTGGLLLLITLYSCTAMPHGPNAVSPGSCCFRFFAQKIPLSEIISITETHSRCSEKGFVFNTPRGKICVRHSLDWAKKVFNEHKEKKNQQLPQLYLQQ
ncbi:C-C motif chemokine 4 Macrophage inflammatory protein 1-beta [Channa argus]|uniref:C-C motif chemokine 4 Macrophage inflammatory protein 1-beta n=2 Tax=Channa argus TaxID=215402 RepID=A0A6G1PGT4_CHAAH|nr:C-C motif chemokine 4 Macrophage inflammatory protein 1-beta [Channa argus]KAK2918266.1 hypothetical protein Q8A73_005012 [Channa argus]